MWFSKIKKKKSQYIMLSIIFIIAIILVSISSIITTSSSAFAKKYYSGDDTPDIVMLCQNEKAVKEFKDWYDKDEYNNRNYKNIDMFAASDNLKLNNSINDNPLSYIVPISDKKDLGSKVDIVKGDKSKKAPGDGEIWMASSIADLNGIKVGDSIEVTTKNNKKIEYKISEIVNDSNQSSTAMGIIIFYVNDSERINLSSLDKGNLITFNFDGDQSVVNEAITDYLNEPINGIMFTKDSLISCAVLTSNLIGGIGLLVAVILIITLILILRSNIRNSILKEYKSIGIYKAIGYSSKFIKRIYLTGYLVVSLISTFIGIIISIPMVNVICNISFKYLEEFSINTEEIIILASAFVFFNLLVYVTLKIILRFVSKIKPVEAINIGLVSSKEKLKKSVIKNNSSSMAMAINDLFKYKKSNLITLIMFIIIFYIAVLFINVGNAMLKIDGNLFKIFGTADSDMTITMTSESKEKTKDIENYLDNNTDIKNFYATNIFLRKSIVIDNQKYNVNKGLFAACLYNTFNEEDFSITEGRNPRNTDEVSVTDLFMKNNNLKLGDYLELTVEGNIKKLLIVGKYYTMMNGGENIRLLDSIIKDNEPNVIFIKLNDTDDYDSIKSDIESKFSGLRIDKVYKSLKDAASQVVDTSVPISIIFVVGVILFGIINIVNILITNNMDNRKNYGIMKSLGFTSSYIKNRNNIKMMFLAVTGSLIGLGINVATSSKLLKTFIGADVFSINILISIALIIVMLTIIGISMHMCNKSIKKISTVELITE